MIWEALPDGCAMKDLMVSPEITLTSTSFGKAPIGSPLSYQLRSTGTAKVRPNVSQKSKTTSTSKSHSFPALPMSSASRLSPKTPAHQVSLAEAQAVERRTTGQASSKEWKDLHQFTLTASNFRRISHCSSGTDSLLKTLFDGGDLSHVSAIKHGKENEGVALSQYVAEMAERGQPVSVRSCGLVLDTNHRFLGASPDGMVYDSTARPRYGLLEVKCPYSAFCKNLTVEQAAKDDRDFCMECVDGGLRLKRSHAYHWQVQGQLAISRLRWCDFFVWTGSSSFVERIRADTSMWVNTMLPKLRAFYFDHAVPYLRLRGRSVCSQSPDQPSLAEFEMLLPEELCQSKIDGRNGSNACTFITILFIKYALQGLTYSTEEAMCRAIRDGNALYDDLTEDGSRLYSVDEVLSNADVGPTLCQESFVRPTPTSFAAMVELMSSQASTSDSSLFGGVFVLTPYSFAMLCDHDQFVLFDSHCHGLFGALLSVVPFENAVTYLQHFFSHHYPTLRFDAQSQILAGHVSFFSLSEN